MAPNEAELTAMLARAGLKLSPEQVRGLLPGAVILQTMIDRVNAGLPREAEPAVMFKPDQV